MNSTWALQDAKNRFSDVVDRACEIEPQIVTRRGTPVAVLISYSAYKTRAARQPSFVDKLLGGPKIEGGLHIERDHAPLRKMEFA